MDKGSLKYFARTVSTLRDCSISTIYIILEITSLSDRADYYSSGFQNGPDVQDRTLDLGFSATPNDFAAVRVNMKPRWWRVSPMRMGWE